MPVILPRQCSGSRCLARWTVWIPRRDRRDEQVERKKDLVTGPDPRFLCPSRCRQARGVPKNSAKAGTKSFVDRPCRYKRQHLGHLRGAPRVGRQDRAAEPLPLAGGLIHPAVVHPRRAHLDRPGHGQRIRVSWRKSCRTRSTVSVNRDLQRSRRVDPARGEPERTAWAGPLSKEG
jgi:hypothetical protein